MVVCVVGVPITKNVAAHRCALQPAALAAAPLTMAIARNVRKPPTRVCGGVPLGAPRRLFCAAAGVSSGLAGGMKAARAKSKLGKIEAKTVVRLHGKYGEIRIVSTVSGLYQASVQIQ